MPESTNRHHPHPAGASERRRASPSGIAEVEPHRSEPREVQVQRWRQIPTMIVSVTAVWGLINRRPSHQSLVTNKFPG